MEFSSKKKKGWGGVAFVWPILQKHWLLEVVPDRSQKRHVTHRTQNFNETCAGGSGTP